MCKLDFIHFTNWSSYISKHWCLLIGQCCSGFHILSLHIYSVILAFHWVSAPFLFSPFVQTMTFKNSLLLCTVTCRPAHHLTSISIWQKERICFINHSLAIFTVGSKQMLLKMTSITMSTISVTSKLHSGKVYSSNWSQTCDSGASIKRSRMKCVGYMRYNS